MQHDDQHTIVTACDSNYFWGAYLLALSVRRAGSLVPIHVLHPNLTPEQIAMLDRLERVRCIPTETPYAMLQKPEALLSANTPWVTWLDCDTLWRGNLEACLGGDQPGIQIRIRSARENAGQFPGVAPHADDSPGAIPGPVLERWRNDVKGIDAPRLRHMAVTNALALHRDFRWLATEWHALMLRISTNPRLLVDRTNLAYRITDEAALTALLAFSETEVPVLPYLLDQDKSRILIHFEGRPKPWQGWQKRYFHHFDTIQELIRWAREQGYDLPPIPDSMVEENRSTYRLRAHIDAIKKAMRVRAGRIVRRMIPVRGRI